MPASTVLRYLSLVFNKVQIRCTTYNRRAPPQANMTILCPSEMPSCTSEFKHTLALNQLATEPEDNVSTAAIAVDHAPLDASNYIGFIMITTAIVVVLSLWVILSFRARRSERKIGEGETEDKQKAEKMSEEWLKGTGRQAEARTEKALDVVQMNAIEYGEGWKGTNNKQLSRQTGREV
ncbi:hypothetical protein PILCRDRAFT_355568 [Piloderma croceum F 1598]|uniref:Uncharacterized protein n=1 Tax=Piloderma croceum (strain F 1598) TaxID=765440 RepID=A0A0C3FZT7_PILCF|nr:hypothetical protein PILCRDRAFT_355568 [Piloderma croceum F 1598]